MKYLIMHGSFGSPDANWFRWLESELKNLGQEVILEQFPSDDWDEVEKLGQERRAEFKPIQSLVSWDQFFVENILQKIKNEPFVFVGHSLAPVFLLHVAEKYNLRVKLAIFVAPFFDIADNKNWQFYPVNKTFYKTDFDFGKLNKLISQSNIIYGDDDPYVPIEQPLQFAEKLGGTAIAVKDGGHLGGAFKELPIILELIMKNLPIKK